MNTAAARALELAGPLGDLFPPVDFCCAYGSTLLHARPDATSMVDYILGVADPLQWHSENLERNPAHYSGWMARLGPGAIIRLSDCVGVGVYFNRFVEWRDKVAWNGCQFDSRAVEIASMQHRTLITHKSL